MAGPNLISGAGGPSLGWGIGLQAEPGNMGYSLAAEGAKMQERERARRAKEDEDANKAWEKYRENFKITKDLDPMYETKAKELAAKHAYLIEEAYAKNPANYPYNNSALMEDRNNLSIDLGIMKNNSDAIRQFNALRTPLMSSGKYDINQENMRIFDEARAKNDPSLLEKIVDENGQPVVYGGAINPTALAGAIFKPKPYDAQKDFLASNIKPIIIERGYQTPGGEYITTSDNKLVDVTASKDNLKALLEDPNWRVGQEYLKRAGGDIDAAADLMFNAYGYKGVDSRKQGLKQKYSGGLSQDQITEAVKTTQVYNAGTDKDGQSRTVEAKSNYLLKPIGVTLQLPQGTINTDDFTLETETGVDKAVSLGEMVNYPVYKGSTSVVSQQEMDKLRDAGKLNTVEYKTFVTASATEKIPGRTGKPERSVTKSYAFPISAIETNPDFRKQNAPSAEWKKAAEEQTKQLHGASSGKTKEVKRRTSDGKIAIFNADTKEFIRWE